LELPANPRNRWINPLREKRHLLNPMIRRLPQKIQRLLLQTRALRRGK